MSTTTIATVSRRQVAEARTEREKELQRLALLAARTTNRSDRDEKVASLLAFIGVIHDIPEAKRTWIDQALPRY